jgi:anti-sigma regulatory factor (Ser/Thr protein kinase)
MEHQRPSGHARHSDTPAETVTSPGGRAMTGAERVRLHRQRKAAAELRYTSDEWRAFVDPAGLQRKAGASWQDMPTLILREVADNAADAANGAGVWLESVVIDDCKWWLIEDHGDGIKPDQVARVFSVNRPLESTKHVRRISRGMLGNRRYANHGGESLQSDRAAH